MNHCDYEKGRQRPKRNGRNEKPKVYNPHCRHDYEVNMVLNKKDPNRASCFDMFRKTACALIQSVPIHCQCVPRNSCEPRRSDCEVNYNQNNNMINMMNQRGGEMDEFGNQSEFGVGGGGGGGGGGKTANKNRSSQRKARRKMEEKQGKERFKMCKRKSKMIYKKYKDKEKVRKKEEKAFFKQCLKNETAKVKEMKKKLKEIKKCVKQTKKTNAKRNKQKLKRLKDRLKQRCEEEKSKITRQPGSDEDEEFPFEDPLSAPDVDVDQEKNRNTNCGNNPCFLDAFDRYSRDTSHARNPQNC